MKYYIGQTVPGLIGAVGARVAIAVAVVLKAEVELVQTLGRQ
jgi:hypothetical protein